MRMQPLAWRRSHRSDRRQRPAHYLLRGRTAYHRPNDVEPPRTGGTSMRFGIFYELSVPRPWTAEAERSVYMNALEQVRLADELGFDQVWAVEHHFLEEYSHCSSPELFLTACAMQTTNIRVGHGI